MSSRGRKESSQHQTAQLTLTVHYHDDGEICPSSIGLVCPLGDIYDQPEPGALPPGIKLPNGLTMQALMGATGGGGFPGMMMVPGMFGGNDMSAMMATMLSMEGGMGPEGFDMSALMGGLGNGEGDVSASLMQSMFSNPMGLAQGPGSNPMAAMAAMAAASQGGNPMAAMAAMVSGGNPMAAMAAMAAAAQGGNPMAAMAAAFGGGPTEGGQPVPPAVAMTRMKVAMAQAATDMQIAKTVATSSLAKLTDSETHTMTEGQFLTTKEFLNFMQSSTTEVCFSKKPTNTILIMQFEKKPFQ